VAYFNLGGCLRNFVAGINNYVRAVRVPIGR